MRGNYLDTHFQLGTIVYIPNSGPEQSSLISTALKRTSIIWDATRYLVNNTNTERVVTNGELPHGINPFLDALSEAEVFYTVGFNYSLFHHNL